MFGMSTLSSAQTEAMNVYVEDFRLLPIPAVSSLTMIASSGPENGARSCLRRAPDCFIRSGARRSQDTPCRKTLFSSLRAPRMSRKGSKGHRDPHALARMLHERPDTNVSFTPDLPPWFRYDLE